MPLIKSISGIRGTIGGKGNEHLSPKQIMTSSLAFGKKIQTETTGPYTIIIGRDGRTSGRMIGAIVQGALQSLGIHVLDIGLTTTPSLANFIKHKQTQGAIMITASHNPIEWNALKLFNRLGECLTPPEAAAVFQLENHTQDLLFAPHHQVGHYQKISNDEVFQHHIEKIIRLPLVKTALIQKKKLRIAVDTINSTGSLIIPQLLKSLKVAHVDLINDTCDGQFAHQPEPLTKHLSQLQTIMKTGQYDIGFAVDPDVDRLVIFDETGEPLGEEYTLVAIADYVLQHSPPHAYTVSHLASTQALTVIAKKHHATHVTSAIGESHVVEKMKEYEASIGGEGNGGIIYPCLNFGRDALVGMALILSSLAQSQTKISLIKKNLPSFQMIKETFPWPINFGWDQLKKTIQTHYPHQKIDYIDGIKIHWENAWLNIRKSNTEPIGRITAEATTQATAKMLIASFKKYI